MWSLCVVYCIVAVYFNVYIYIYIYYVTTLAIYTTGHDTQWTYYDNGAIVGQRVVRGDADIECKHVITAIFVFIPMKITRIILGLLLFLDY